MSVKVVAASAFGALLFGEPQAQAIAVRLADATLAAPALLPFEVANIALKKIRRHPHLCAPLLTAFSLFGRMAIEIIAVDHDEIVRLADETGLTAYDFELSVAGENARRRVGHPRSPTSCNRLRNELVPVVFSLPSTEP